MALLSEREIEERLAELPGWRRVGTAIEKRFERGDFAGSVRFVADLLEPAEEMNHHPDVRLTYPRVDLRLWSHDAGGITERDLDLARRVSQIAAEQGIAAVPEEVEEVEVALDTADASRVAPFWAAVLTGDASNVDGPQVIDPTGRVPLLWFQQTDPHETPRQRFHLDVWVPPEVARQRIDAALAAGGTVADDEPETFTVLADPDGNRVCICTVEGR